MPTTTPTSGVFVVQGLDELVRAFRVANREVAKDVQEAIMLAGEPIRQDATNRVRAEISGMARSRLPWWQIRLGIEKRTIGYIVPQQRGVKYNTRRGGPNAVQAKRKRPNLAELIAEQEMLARDAHTHRVEGELVDALNEVARAWARA